MAIEWIPEKCDPAELKEHPVSTQVYGAITIDPELRDSIREHGVVYPIMVNKDGVVLAGHRRRVHAIAAGLKSYFKT